MSNQTHHTIDYIEIPVQDMEKSKSFYGEIFGWKFTDYAPTYVGIQKQGGGEVGGFRLEEKVTPGGPLIVLYSENLEQSFQAVKKVGTKIDKEIYDFPGGKRFEFRDPNGHFLAIWSHS